MISMNPIIPMWIKRKSMVIYMSALAIVTLTYFNYSMPWYYLLSGVLSVYILLYYGTKLNGIWNVTGKYNEKKIERGVFLVSFVFRVLWVVTIYVIFQNTYDNAFGFENGDPIFYDDLGNFVASLVREGNYNFYDEIKRYSNADISDMGYGVYLGFVYLLTGNNILIARLLKCVWSSMTVVLIYRLATRNFGQDTGRLAAVFCALWPNFWYYCGTHLKETEMVFLGVLFVEQADQMLRTKNFSAWKVIPLLFIVATLFTIRTPLAIVCVLSLLFSIFMSSTRVVGWGKRIVIGVLAISLVGVSMGDSIAQQVGQLIQQTNSGEQQRNMEWRSVRENGNKFAKYAGKAVFAPFIFTLPFPSMVRPYNGQDVQQLLNGGNYTKNVLSFFTILVLFMLLLSGRWREHSVPLSYMLGYLVVLALSTFAQSERFHQPAMPMELMFAAYGIQQVLQGVPIVPGFGSRAKYRQWFTYWMYFILVVCIAWNWFKLAGRDLA